MRRLQSLAGPWAAMFGSQPDGRNFRSAASGTTKSSCILKFGIVLDERLGLRRDRCAENASETARPCKCSLSTHGFLPVGVSCPVSVVPACDALPVSEDGLCSWFPSAAHCGAGGMAKVPFPADKVPLLAAPSQRRMMQSRYDRGGRSSAPRPKAGRHCCSRRRGRRRARCPMRCGTAARSARSCSSFSSLIDVIAGLIARRGDDPAGAHLHPDRDRRLDGAGRAAGQRGGGI
mgnify:CR=1 FL=1